MKVSSSKEKIAKAHELYSLRRMINEMAKKEAFLKKYFKAELKGETGHFEGVTITFEKRNRKDLDKVLLEEELGDLNPYYKFSEYECVKVFADKEAVVGYDPQICSPSLVDYAT